MSEKKGIYNKKRDEITPDFVLLKFCIKIDEIKEYANEKGFVNIDVLTSKSGEVYAKVNDYKSTYTSEPKPYKKDDTEEVPF